MDPIESGEALKNDEAVQVRPPPRAFGGLRSQHIGQDLYHPLVAARPLEELRL